MNPVDFDGVSIVLLDRPIGNPGCQIVAGGWGQFDGETFSIVSDNGEVFALDDQMMNAVETPLTGYWKKKYSEFDWYLVCPGKVTPMAKPSKRHRCLLLAILIFAASFVTLFRLLPFGVSPIPFGLASVDEGHRIAGTGYDVIYNDAGGAHSGRFWTWIIKDYWVCRVVVAEGYSTTDVRYGDSPIPTRKIDGAIEVGFVTTRDHGSGEKMRWVALD